MPYRFWAVETSPEQCAGILLVANKNNLTVEANCSRASVKELTAFINAETAVDVLDLDIQDAEKDILGDQNLRNLIDMRVKRIIIGTHSIEILRSMTALFRQ